ncbi:MULTISPECIES: hypothetical protein [Methylobacterium]|uniref:Uncharacterized protein n=2 Tax=Methylobacterium TaxID=407 RepID=A0A0C6FL76_9HYPH|nr:hypothetical protein [Methylobacterium aquaticum]QRE77185.1 hypothetical protein F1D61_29865 [Methylobacterium aquaticum]BAQ45914.1 hypothetical protein Maq22A_c13500 [Methylobacterium aquaticum]
MAIVEPDYRLPAASTETWAPVPAENPKTGAGRLKPEPHLISPVALLWLNAALENGAIKYGPFN